MTGKAAGHIFKSQLMKRMQSVIYLIMYNEISAQSVIIFMQPYNPQSVEVDFLSLKTGK
jgi:hypothetical protein